MSRRDDRVSLLDMRDYAAEAVELTEGKSLDDVVQDRVMQLALLKLVETVGEAANRVSDRMKMKHMEIPWHQIVGMRNRLVHGYHDANLDILWKVILQDLPLLIEQLDTIIGEETP